MELRNARVHWWEGCGNPPQLVALVDRLIPDDELRFRVISDYEGSPAGNASRRSPLYVAVKDGLVVPWWHDPKNENGCGGAVFKFKMEDGSTATAKGPWRYPYSEGVKRLWGTTPKECFLTDNEEAFFKLAPGGWRPGVTYDHRLRSEYVTHEFWMQAVEASGCWLAEVTRVHNFRTPLVWTEPVMERSPPKNVGPGDSWRYVYPDIAVEKWVGGRIAPLEEASTEAA